jgi:hypothetical protein
VPGLRHPGQAATAGPDPRGLAPHQRTSSRPRPRHTEQRALIELRAHLELERAQAELTSRWDRIGDIDQAIEEVEEAISAEGLRGSLTPHTRPDDDQGDTDAPRRVRSTKRRQDVPDLPRRRVEPRTLGRVYTAPDGATYQPSMWLTLTLDSYGPVHAVRRAAGGTLIPCACRRVHADDDPAIGTPVDPDHYDYRRAGWDAVHLPRLLDRFWQNLRRAEGWNVQYAGCVEPQRRLAPHARFAIRGTIPRAMLLKVAAATYHHVWWPPADELVYQPDRAPVWDPDRTTWVDPTPAHPWPRGRTPSTRSTANPMPPRPMWSGRGASQRQGRQRRLPRR